MPQDRYYRPVVQSDPVRTAGAVSLAGGRYWFDRAEVLERGSSRGLIPAREVPTAVLDRLTEPRAPMATLSMDRARIMAVVNVTPDSFSDGGDHHNLDAALSAAEAAVAAGADILDIGGESTRPGAATVPVDEEINRIVPVIEALRARLDVPISVDTRKAPVAKAALAAGATMLNDVSAGTYDADMLPLAAASGAPICLMHAQGDPATMQKDPSYDDVLLDVYDSLADRIAAAEAHGIPRHQIIVDPGIGFGKTLTHNLRLLNNLSLFHGLGCAILLGVSRKRFIGTIGAAPEPKDRMPGSVAVALSGIAQGVQIVRVHDTAATKQALALFDAVTGQYWE